MELYIGGYAQGKTDYALNIHKGQRWITVDGGRMPDAFPWETGERLCVHHFHRWVKKLLEEGKEPEKRVEELIRKYPDCIVICDEVGNGIVPEKPGEREYRERLGRILIKLAAKAERVERVLCGIGQRLK